MDDPELIARSEAYLDRIFGPGSGAKHTEFLRYLKNDGLRETLHRYHLLEDRTEHLSIEENYLLGACVLYATKNVGPAGMFVKTLLHLGTKKEKILEAVARMSMWIGGVPAAEIAGHAQKAIREYEERGQASLEAWFPDRR
jgi:hypothetical protein